MSDSQSETSSGTTTSSGTSTVVDSGISSTGTTVITSDPGTSSSQQQHSKMGVENKLSSSSREMRNMAEKMRRDKLNNYVAEIAGIVPLGSGANKRIDKTSVLRLAANYIRMHKILKDDDDTSYKVPINLGGDITNSLAEAVGGFLLLVTSSGKVVYITEAVDQFFGHTQVDLLGHSIYSVIHPDDHEIFQQQLLPKDNNSRRSFFCRMMEKALSRNDPGHYEIIHVVGQLRPLPQGQISLSPCPVTSPAAMSPGETIPSSDHDDDDSSDNEGELQPLKMTNRTGSHMLVGFVRVVKDRPITELSLVESTQDEYITRHGMDAKILYTDHRISFVTGLMPSEVVGTSAFNYMHQDDILWSIVAQKLMFTSTQGQGTVSYRLRCRDGAHITLRSRGFLEVNKQTGQVESFVCINTVLSIKEATTEIKNQRRKLLPIIACNDAEDHLGSISSSLPPELIMVLKQMMNPETMQKMIASVTKSDSLHTESSEEPKDFPVDSGTSLTPIPEIAADVMKNKAYVNIGHSLQTKPKIHSSEVLPYESVPESCAASVSVNKDQWHRMAKKRSSIDDFSTVVSKKFSFEKNLPCPELLHKNYTTNTFNPQFSPRTMSPQSNLSPTTSLVPENIQNYPSGTCQQYSGSVHTSDSSSQSYGVKSSLVHPKISQQYQNTDTASCGQSVVASEKNNPKVSQNMPSPTNYSQRIENELTSQNFEPSKEDGGTISPSLCELRLTNSENSYSVLHQRIREGLPSPDDTSQNRTGGISTSGIVLQNRCNVLPAHGTNSNSIGIYKQITSPGISSPGSYNQNICPGLMSVRDCNHDERKDNSSSQDHGQSDSRNISCNIPSNECSYQYMSSPEDQSTLLPNQFFPQYQQQSSSTPYPVTQPQYQYPISPQDQGFTLSRQTSSNTRPGQYSELSPQMQKQHSPHHVREISTDRESDLHDVPISTSSSIHISEVGTSGVPSVHESTIPEQCSSREDPVSKDTGNMFSNGHFQLYPTHNQHGGKLL